MTPREENALSMLRRLADSEYHRHSSKQKAAGVATDKQLPLVLGPPVDDIAVRAVLVEFNLVYLGSKNRNSSATGRSAEEVRTPDGTVEKPPLQLTLFEADAVVARKRDLAAGITFEADYLQALRDLAAERATEAGLDPERDIVVIGDYVGGDEAADLRQRLVS